MSTRDSSLHTTQKVLPKAALVGVLLPGMTEAENQSSLAELERLVTTLGFSPVAKLWQKRQSVASAVVLGDGKLQELARMTGGTGVVGTSAIRVKTRAELRRDKEKEEAEAAEAEKKEAAFSFNSDDDEDGSSENSEDGESEDEGSPESKVKADVVVFDCELSPSQLSNLHKALGCEVLDRTGVIVEIFSRHARTREARIQVEIARLSYLAPRIRETGDSGDRGGGGGTGGRGAGETSIELDRRRIRDRISELRADLESVQQESNTRRQRRNDQAEVATVALVGYTNAGKSSLMRALTGSEVLVADKLFATLDTSVRALHPETHPRILVSDTVGFIKRLPHDLVASFRSTLDEARNASLLLFVVDASDSSFRSQLAVTKQVLGEIGVDDIPGRIVLNKSDCLSTDERASLAAEFPDAIFLSTRNPADVAALRDTLQEFFEEGYVEEDLFLPYSKPSLVGDVRRAFRVVGEAYDEEGVTFRVRAPKNDLEQFRVRMA